MEQLPPRHSSILPLWWEHISPALWLSSLLWLTHSLAALLCHLFFFLMFFQGLKLLPPLCECDSPPSSQNVTREHLLWNTFKQRQTYLQIAEVWVLRLLGGTRVATVLRWSLSMLRASSVWWPHLASPFLRSTFLIISDSFWPVCGRQWKSENRSIIHSYKLKIMNQSFWQFPSMPIYLAAEDRSARQLTAEPILYYSHLHIYTFYIVCHCLHNEATERRLIASLMSAPHV